MINMMGYGGGGWKMLYDECWTMDVVYNWWCMLDIMGYGWFIIDAEGKYACSEFCTGIIDDVENLENIAKVLNSSNFKDIILATSVSKAEINRKILKYFKKDFWKQFI